MQRDCFSYLKYLGKYYGEEEISNLTTEFQILKIPKLPKGDIDVNLTNHTIGIELTFTDENHLDVKITEYPENALVLTNIRFNGVADKKIQKYEGLLPFRLQFGMSRAEVIKLVGYPDNPKYSGGVLVDPSGQKRNMRWDKKDYCFFARYDEEKFSVFSIQLPVSPP